MMRHRVPFRSLELDVSMLLLASGLFLQEGKLLLFVVSMIVVLESFRNGLVIWMYDTVVLTLILMIAIADDTDTELSIVTIWRFSILTWIQCAAIHRSSLLRSKVL